MPHSITGVIRRQGCPNQCRQDRGGADALRSRADPPKLRGQSGATHKTARPLKIGGAPTAIMVGVALKGGPADSGARRKRRIAEGKRIPVETVVLLVVTALLAGVVYFAMQILGRLHNVTSTLGRLESGTSAHAIESCRGLESAVTAPQLP